MKYEELNYWFLPTKDINTWEIWDKNNLDDQPVDGQPVGVVYHVYDDEERQFEITVGDAATIEQCQADFNTFYDSEEYLIGLEVDVNVSTDTLIDNYKARLVGSYRLKLARLKLNPDKYEKQIESSIAWLTSTDFFIAPGSTQFHDSEPSGLVKHSLRVFNNIIKLHQAPQFNIVPVESAVLVSLVHDWCKIGLYTSYNRNVKNEATGKWEQVVAYRHNQQGVPLGHGVSSMFLASRCFKLSIYESVAIRWHMGTWNVAPNEQNELQLANEQYPLVHLLQFADCLSITSYNK